MTLDDLTSGFNIGRNVSMAPELDKMLGFSTEDVREMFTYYKEVEMLPAGCDIEAMIEEMKPWYDNYCFAKECLKSDVRMFNCDMVMLLSQELCLIRSSTGDNARPEYKDRLQQAQGINKT